jgi:hypothetical protein
VSSLIHCHSIIGWMWTALRSETWRTWYSGYGESIWEDTYVNFSDWWISLTGDDRTGAEFLGVGSCKNAGMSFSVLRLFSYSLNVDASEFFQWDFGDPEDVSISSCRSIAHFQNDAATIFATLGWGFRNRLLKLNSIIVWSSSKSYSIRCCRSVRLRFLAKRTDFDIMRYSLYHLLGYQFPGMMSPGSANLLDVVDLIGMGYVYLSHRDLAEAERSEL